jgi:hypothetical protein
MAWPASLIADVRAASSAWNSGRGGWRATWRGALKFVRQHHITVETRVGTQVVLRTRIRLTGDVQTDIVRTWLNTAATGPELRDTANSHFRSVAAAVHGWAVLGAHIRLVSDAFIAAGSLTAFVSAWRNLPAFEWHAFLALVLSQAWLLAGVITAIVGLGIRKGAAFWLRRLFRRSLAEIQDQI